MFDAKVRPLIDPPLERIATAAIRAGWSADGVTLIGFVIGLLALPAIAFGAYWLGLFFILLNRCADGLDGAIARQTKKTDRGGFLDISLDFIFYSSIPFAFALADPSANALAAAFLIFSFIGTGLCGHGGETGAQHRHPGSKIPLLSRRPDRRHGNHRPFRDRLPAACLVFDVRLDFWDSLLDDDRDPDLCWLEDVRVAYFDLRRLASCQQRPPTIGARTQAPFTAVPRAAMPIDFPTIPPASAPPHAALPCRVFRNDEVLSFNMLPTLMSALEVDWHISRLLY